MDFSDLSIVITGSGAGIGKFAAREMASRGGLITISDVDAERARTAADEINNSGGKPSPWKEM